MDAPVTLSVDDPLARAAVDAIRTGDVEALDALVRCSADIEAPGSDIGDGSGRPPVGPATGRSSGRLER